MDADTGKESDNPILTGPFWPVFFRYALPSVAGRFLRFRPTKLIPSSV